MARVERELQDSRNFSAVFVCALALAAPSGELDLFEGEVHGQLVFPPRGKNGFGYDPIFIADGMSETFGEIAPALKHAISHRARAFAKFAVSAFSMSYGPDASGFTSIGRFAPPKCPYCDFNSHVRSAIDETGWAEAITSRNGDGCGMAGR